MGRRRRRVVAVALLAAAVVLVAMPAAAAAAAPRGAPSVTGLSIGTVNQGETTYVTVDGTGFASGASVSLGPGLRCQVQSVSATTVAVRVVVGDDAQVGPRTATVRNPDGESGSLRKALHVDYVPVLAKWAIGEGAVDWTTTLVRPSFASAPTVSVAGGGVSVVSASVRAGTLSLGFTVDRHAAPTWRTMTITQGLATWTVEHGVKVRPAPTITSVTPLGQSTTDQGVRVVGANFEVCKDVEPTLVVSGTGVTVDSVSSALGTLLYATLTVAPAAPLGSRDVTMTNCDSGGSATSAGVFQVLGTPAVHRVAPIALGVTRVESFVGVNLTPTTTLVAGGTGVSIDHVQYVSQTRLRATIDVSPTAALGPHDVTATNTGGAGSVASGVLVVDALPTLSALGVGGIGANTSVSLSVSGTGFERGATLLVDGASVPYLTVAAPTLVSAAELKTTATAATATPLGSVLVAVENPDGGVSGTVGLATNPGPRLAVAPSATRAGALAVADTPPAGAPSGEVYSLRVCTDAALTTGCVTRTGLGELAQVRGLVAGQGYFAQLTAPTSGSFYDARSSVVGPRRATSQLVAPALTSVAPSSTTAGAIALRFARPTRDPATTVFEGVACLDSAMTRACVRGHVVADGQLAGLVAGRPYHLEVVAVAAVGYLAAKSRVSALTRATVQLGVPTVKAASVAGGVLRVDFDSAKGAGRAQSYLLRACENAALTRGCLVRRYYHRRQGVAVRGTTWFVRVTAVASPGYLAASSAVVRASG